MKYVLDTTELSALMKGHEGAIERLKAARRREVLVPQPVIAEIAYGLARMPRSARRRTLRARFDLLLGELTRSEWTDAVSERFGQTKAALERAGHPLSDFDVAIAAHALAERAILVTANLSHMERIPDLEMERWSQS